MVYVFIRVSNVKKEVGF